MNALKIYLLGRPIIEWHDQQVDNFVSEKALTLFAYLVVHPEKQARETLAGLFWGDMRAARARANLRMAIYNLQQLFPGYLLGGRLSVEFNRDLDYWLDIEQFEKTLQPASEFNPLQVKSYEKALSLYRGDFMDGIYLDMSELDEWLLVERERLRQLALRGYQFFADQLMDAGEFASAVPAWQSLLRLEPWQESAHQGLMLALARQGDYTIALEQYEICRRLLADELHVEPMPETIQLYQRIRAARDLEARHNLPPQPAPFFGRERELKDIEKKLADPQTRLVTITGPGGIGKSRLAVQAAAEQVHAFLHGVWLVPLETCSASESLLMAIGACLKLSFHGRANMKSQLFQYLQDRELLLVLDNFDNLVEGAALIAEMLAEAPQVKILVTSRQRLRLQEEHHFRLSGLEYPAQGSEQQAEAFPAVQLFIESGQRALNRFVPEEKDISDIVQICQMVEGMPLGIEMAAAWVDHLSTKEIAATIQANMNSLSSSMRNVPERHRSLQAVFDYSWDLLSGAEKVVLRRISIFRGGFTLQAAASITGASERRLTSLADKSLLRITSDPDGSTRFGLHELVRQLSGEKLSETSEEPLLREKYLNYYLHFSEEAGDRLDQADQAIWIERMEQDHPNLQQALDWCKVRQDGGSAGLRLAIALAQFWEIRGYFKEGLSRLQTFYRSCSEATIELQVGALVSTGRLAFLSGDFELARLKYEQSIAICRDAHHGLGLLDSLNGLVAVLTDQGDYQQAALLGEEALELARQSESQEKIALATNNLGLINWHQGNLPSAHGYLEESLERNRKMGNQLGAAHALNNLALVDLDEDKPAEAARLLEDSLVIRRRLGERRGMSFVLGNLGVTAQYQGEFARALGYFQESLEIRRELGDRHYIAHTLGTLGSVAQTLGDYTTARGYYQEGLSIARRLEDGQIIAFLSRELGSLFSDLADFQPAVILLEEAVSMEQAMGMGRSLSMALEKMAKLAYRMGDYGRAQAIAEQCCEISTHIHFLRGIARCHFMLGKLSLLSRKTGKAREYFKSAYEILARTANPLEISAVLEGIASLAMREDEPANALILLGRAGALRESSKAPLPPADRPEVERIVHLAREKISEKDYQHAWEKGRESPDEQSLPILDLLKMV